MAIILTASTSWLPLTAPRVGRGKTSAGKKPLPADDEPACGEGVAAEADESPAGRLARVMAASDELSAAVNLLCSQRSLLRRYRLSRTERFAQVLDEEVEDKITPLLQLLAAGTDADSQILLAQIRQLFPDDSDCVVILRDLLEQPEAEPWRQRIASLLLLARQHSDARRVQAGINIALKARLFGQALQISPALMRESYREFITSDGSEIPLYQRWIAHYGISLRQVMVDFMESALLADISALDPSCSQLEFGNSLQRCGQLKRLRSADISFVSPLQQRYAWDGSEQQWVSLMLALLQGETELDHPDHFYLQPAADAGLIQGILRGVRALPIELFGEPLDKALAEQQLLRCAAQHLQAERR